MTVKVLERFHELIDHREFYYSEISIERTLDMTLEMSRLCARIVANVCNWIKIMICETGFNFWKPGKRRGTEIWKRNDS